VITEKPSDWTSNTWKAWYAILSLTPTELDKLKKGLLEMFGPDDDTMLGGVREPRRPRPPSPSSSIALELPEGDVGSDMSAPT
jgi:hypothetical protein